MSVFGQRQATNARACRRSLWPILGLPAVTMLLAAGLASQAAAKVRVTGLIDANFGTIANLTIDAVLAQSLCVYSNGSGNSYSIRADGSGAGGAYTLSNGVTTLAYDVRWNSQAGQTNGTILSPGAILAGQTTIAQNQTCSNGPATTASLIVTLPATSLSSAGAGNYSGSLTIIVAEE
jgi:hypothetical protein